MSKYNFIPVLTKEHLMFMSLNAFYNNLKNSGKQLHFLGMNYNFDKSNPTSKLKLLTPEQNIAHERLESNRKTNVNLDNQVKTFAAYGTLGYGIYLLASAIIDNFDND